MLSDDLWFFVSKNLSTLWRPEENCFQGLIVALEVLYCRLARSTSGLKIRWDSAGIFKQSMGAGNRVRIGLSYRPARLHRLAELIPWNRFLGSLNVYKYCIGSARQATLHSLAELVPSNRFLGSFKVYKFGLTDEYIGIKAGRHTRTCI